jgi:hypothetical protein
MILQTRLIEVTNKDSILLRQPRLELSSIAPNNLAQNKIRFGGIWFEI